MQSAGERNNLPFDIVIVEWVDAWSDADWRAIETMTEYGGLTCATVGWLLKETKQAVTLAQCMSTDVDAKTGAGCFVIPRVCVTAIRVLMEAQK